MHPINAAAPTTADLAWVDEAATQAAAARLAQALLQSPAPRNAFIELHGDLGAGKTTFIRHLLRACGVQGRIKSPTYAVVEPYDIATPDGNLPAWHFDFYRFKHPREFAEAGLGDLFAQPGLKIAEWPQKAQGELPIADLQIHIAQATDDESARQVELVAQTAAGQSLLAALAGFAAPAL